MKTSKFYEIENNDYEIIEGEAVQNSDELHTQKKKSKYLGGLKYSQIIKKYKNPVIGLYKTIKNTKSSKIIIKLFLRSFATGFKIPAVPFVKRNKEKYYNFLLNLCRDWGRDLLKIINAKLHVYNSDGIKKGKTYLFAANHLSPIDIPALYAGIPVLAAFVSNMDVATLPVFRFWMKEAGSVFVKWKDKASQIKALRDIIKRLESGKNMILFPESKMSSDGKIKEFQRGGLFAATFTNSTIIPIYIKGTREILKPGEFEINIGKDIILAFGKEIDTSVLSKNEKKNIHHLVYNELIHLSEIYDPVYQDLCNSSLNLAVE